MSDHETPQNRRGKRRAHPDDDWPADWDLQREPSDPPLPLPSPSPPARPPYGYQYMEGSLRSLRRYAERPAAEPSPNAGLRYIRALYKRATRRWESPLARGVRVHDEVRAIGDSHLTEVAGDVVAAHEGAPVRGCPWCIDQARADRADEMLRAMNADEWYLLSAHTARFMLALDDLSHERAR